MRFIRSLFTIVFGLFLVAGIASAVAAAVMKGRLESRADESDDEVDLVTIFEGRDFTSAATAFRGGSILTWYGGGTIDLRGATLDAGGATLDLKAIFGGIRLVVPETWRVELSTIGVFGGIGDARDQDRIAPDGPTLRLTGFAIFGGAGIVSEAPDLTAAAAEV
jgi:predicted membrane protein